MKYSYWTKRWILIKKICKISNWHHLNNTFPCPVLFFLILPPTNIIIIIYTNIISLLANTMLAKVTHSFSPSILVWTNPVTTWSVKQHNREQGINTTLKKNKNKKWLKLQWRSFASLPLTGMRVSLSLLSVCWHDYKKTIEPIFLKPVGGCDDSGAL